MHSKCRQNCLSSELLLIIAKLFYMIKIFIKKLISNNIYIQIS